jgi:tRNA 2-thiocytidine biosynthesis protein TtcA
MMADWDRRYPGRTEAVFSALQNVVPSHLADQSLFDFKELHVGAALAAMDGGDTVFDGPQFGEELTLPEPFPMQVVTA